MKPIIYLGTLSLLSLALNANENTSENRWRLSAGAAWRNVGEFSLQPNIGSSDDFFASPPAAGDLSAAADRTYDDGFVNIGAATAGTGLTTNWSYDDVSQIDGSTIVYTVDGGSALGTPSAESEDAQDLIAPYIEVAYTLHSDSGFRISGVLNAVYSELNNSVQQQLDQYNVTATDTYSLKGIDPLSLPGPGAGLNFSGPGPLISNTPAERKFSPVLLGSQDYSFEVDTDVYSIGLGAEFHWQTAERFALSISPGVVMNLIQTEAKSTSPVLSGTNYISSRQSHSKDELIWGLYLQGKLDYKLTEQWSLNGFVRYDCTEELEQSLGETEYSIDLSGVSVGIALTYWLNN